MTRPPPPLFVLETNEPSRPSVLDLDFRPNEATDHGLKMEIETQRLYFTKQIKSAFKQQQIAETGIFTFRGVSVPLRPDPRNPKSFKPPVFEALLLDDVSPSNPLIRDWNTHLLVHGSHFSGRVWACDSKCPYHKLYPPSSTQLKSLKESIAPNFEFPLNKFAEFGKQFEPKAPKATLETLESVDHSSELVTRINSDLMKLGFEEFNPERTFAEVNSNSGALF